MFFVVVVLLDLTSWYKVTKSTWIWT